MMFKDSRQTIMFVDIFQRGKINKRQPDYANVSFEPTANQCRMAKRQGNVTNEVLR